MSSKSALAPRKHQYQGLRSWYKYKYKYTNTRKGFILLISLTHNSTTRRWEREGAFQWTYPFIIPHYWLLPTNYWLSLVDWFSKMVKQICAWCIEKHGTVWKPIRVWGGLVCCERLWKWKERKANQKNRNWTEEQLLSESESFPSLHPSIHQFLVTIALDKPLKPSLKVCIEWIFSLCMSL